MLHISREQVIRETAKTLVAEELPLELPNDRYERMRSDLLRVSDDLGTWTEWGEQLPSPDVSLEFLEQLASLSPYMARLSLRLTVDESQGCWALPLAKEHDEKGRGKYPLVTDVANNARSTMGHRYTWKLLIDPTIPSELYLDHLCRVHACCNVAHLEPVTSSINTKRGNDARHILGGQGTLFHAK